MIRRIARSLLAPLMAVVLTLGVVALTSSLRVSGSSARAAAPAVVTANRFLLTAGSLGQFAFTELAGISSQIDAQQYVYSNGSPLITHTNKYGKSKPPTVVLKRNLNDTAGQRIWAWHETAVTQKPSARVNATLQVIDSTGKAVVTYRLLNAWPSTVNLSGVKAGQSDVVQLTLTLTCDTITTVVAGP